MSTFCSPVQLCLPGMNSLLSLKLKLCFVPYFAGAYLKFQLKGWAFLEGGCLIEGGGGGLK